MFSSPLSSSSVSQAHNLELRTPPRMQSWQVGLGEDSGSPEHVITVVILVMSDWNLGWGVDPMYCIPFKDSESSPDGNKKHRYVFGVEKNVCVF